MNPPATVSSWALKSELVYRFEISLVVLVALYVVLTLLWLAAHGRTLRGVTVGPASAEIPQATDEVQGSAQAIEGFSDTLRVLAENTAEGLAYHDVRLARIETGIAEQLPGEVPPPPGTTVVDVDEAGDETVDDLGNQNPERQDSGVSETKGGDASPRHSDESLDKRGDDGAK